MGASATLALGTATSTRRGEAAPSGRQGGRAVAACGRHAYCKRPVSAGLAAWLQPVGRPAGLQAGLQTAQQKGSWPSGCAVSHPAQYLRPILTRSCETELSTNDNCGACGNVCDIGLHCANTASPADPPVYECVCGESDSSSSHACGHTGARVSEAWLQTCPDPGLRLTRVPRHT